MKKFIMIAACFLAIVTVSAQSLEEIVKNYTVANKLDKLSGLKTIKITGSMSVSGMELPMEVYMKSPDKIKTVTSFNGTEIVQSFDGEKGYSINPMTGSSDPVDMTADQVKELIRSNMFQNFMANYLKNGQLTLAGEEEVSGKPAFRINAKLDNGTNVAMFIDKASYLLVKTSADVNQGGMSVTVESFPSDYQETSGVLLPMKTTSSASGMEFVTTFSKVEVDLPLEDSIFKLK
jgi:outer membrane lipoprotein-sorting protein